MVAPLTRFELVTYGLEVRCSIQLSYSDLDYIVLAIYSFCANEQLAVAESPAYELCTLSKLSIKKSLLPFAETKK